MDPLQWKVAVTMLLGSCLLFYAERAMWSVMLVALARDFNWTPWQQGSLLGAFYVGYLLTQLPGGLWADKSAALSSWALLAAMLAIAGAMLLSWLMGHSLSPRPLALWSLLTALRLIVGLLQRPAFPAMSAVVVERVPLAWRAFCTAAIPGVCYLGTVLALLLGPMVLQHFQWTALCAIVLVLSCVWSSLWFAIRRQVLQEPLLVAMDIDWTIPNKLLRHRAVQTLIAVNFLASHGFWIVMSWLPTFLHDRFGVDIAVLGNLAWRPFLLQGVLTLSLGYAVDRFALPLGWMTRPQVRRWSETVSMTGSTVCLLTLCWILWRSSSADDGDGNSLGLVTWLITGSVALTAFSAIGCNTTHVDVCPEHAGALYALVNTGTVLAGAVGVPLTGLLLQTVDAGVRWSAVFAISSVLQAVALLLWWIRMDFEPLLLGS
jgi:MFS family permease